jgi:ribosomal protein S1
MMSFAGGLIHLKGRVTKIENSEAVVRNSAGHESRVPLKRLSERDKKIVNDGLKSKQVVELDLPPQTFLR